MKRSTIILFTVFISFVIFFAGELLAYTVTYEQTIKTSFGPETKMRVMAKDNLLRMETGAGAQEVVIIGNDTGAYSYLPSQNMATKVKRNEIDENYIKYPEKYLDHIKVLGAKKIHTTDIEGETCDIYTYKDITTGAQIRSYVSRSKRLPIKMVIKNSFGESEILFKNIKIGEKLPDNLFFIPKDVKIIDAEQI